jgi:lipoate-protein ligase A
MATRPKLRVMISETHNPWFNLATEDWIFREMDPSAQTLFLWRNQNTVVIGRNQNPWSECNLARMEAEQIHLARRASGGGAVFQDLGNSIFTFLSPRDGYNRAANSNIILRALKRFGIQADVSGRNDIVVPMEDGPRKISGSAFRETRDRCFHHGTLLLSTDLTRLENFLTPHPKKLQSKGKASVRARVMNLTELNSALDHETVCKALIEEFFAEHQGTCEIETLDQAWLEGIPTLREKYEHLASWDWRFGHAPQFHHEMAEYLSWGFVQVFVDSEQGQITRARVFSDSLFPALVEAIETALQGKAYSQVGVEQAVAEATQLQPAHEAELKEFAMWMKTQVEV